MLTRVLTIYDSKYEKSRCMIVTLEELILRGITSFISLADLVYISILQILPRLLRNHFQRVIRVGFNSFRMLSGINCKVNKIIPRYTMNMWIKLAAGMIGGIAIIASLCGFTDKKGSQSSVCEKDSSEISDDILDGDFSSLEDEPRAQESDCGSKETRENRLRKSAEKSLRGLQKGFSKATDVVANLSVILNSILNIFYGDPSYRIDHSQTSIIF